MLASPRLATSEAGFSVATGVVINEVVADARDAAPDWIELYNSQTVAVDLSGWTLRDSDDGVTPSSTHVYTIPAGLVIEPGHYLVLEENAEGSFTFGFGRTDGAFLFDASGVMVDSTTWRDGQAPAGTSWSRLSSGFGPFTTLDDVTRGEQNRGEPVSSDPQAWVFDGNTIRSYHLEIPAEQLEYLNSHAGDETYVAGYLEFEGQTFGPVGIRYNGNADLYSCVGENGEPICEKMPWKVSLHEFDASARFNTLRKLQFHNMLNDNSYMRERISHGLFEEMGVPTSRVVYARLFVNDQYMGFFALTEQIDGAFTRDRFADGGEGNLYKEIWPQYRSSDPYLGALETNEDENPDVSRMVSFAKDLLKTDPEASRSMLEKYIDVSYMANYLAVDRGINNNDGIMGWYCYRGFCFNHNYYWYESVDHTRLTLIPWDMDYTLTPGVWIGIWDPWYEQPSVCRPRMVAQSPACDELIFDLATVAWTDYTTAAQIFLDGPFSEAAIGEKLDFYSSQIEPLLSEEPGEVTVESWRSNVDQLVLDIATLRATLQEEIQQTP